MGARARVGLAAVALAAVLGACGNGSTRLPALAPTSNGWPVGATRALRVSEPGMRACTVYVAPGGSRTAAGRHPRHPSTLDSALARSGPGSVICLLRGRYRTATSITLPHSGSPGRPITLRGLAGRALIQYVGPTMDGGVLQTALGAGWGGGHDIVLAHLRIDGADRIGGGIFIRNGSHNVTVVGCHITNTGATGIGLNAVDHVTVLDNTVHHVGYAQGWSSGISLWYGGQNHTYGGPTAWFDRTRGFHNIIAGNVVSGAFDNSAHRTDGNGIIVDGSGAIPPVLIANNIVAENGGAGIAVIDNSGQVWVVDNTAYADGLDLRVAGGQAAELEALHSSGTHFVDNIASGRLRARTYLSAYLFSQVDSQVSWLGNLGDHGTSIGLNDSLVAARTHVGSGDPGFVATPGLSAGPAPWAHAPAPGLLGVALQLQADAAAWHVGVNPYRVPGLTPALARGLRRDASRAFPSNRGSIPSSGGSLTAGG